MTTGANVGSSRPLGPPALPHQDATACPPAVLRPLFDALDALGSNIDIDDLRSAVTALRLTREDLGPVIMIDTGAYVRTLVRNTPEYQVLVMAWLPGQRSPIHDHRGSACAVRVVAGRGREQVFEPLADGAVKPSSSRLYEPGEVACSVDEDIHSFGNAAAGPASPDDILVTLHVYAPPLAKTRKYHVADGG